MRFFDLLNETAIVNQGLIEGIMQWILRQEGIRNKFQNEEINDFYYKTLVKRINSGQVPDALLPVNIEEWMQKDPEIIKKNSWLPRALENGENNFFAYDDKAIHHQIREIVHCLQAMDIDLQTVNIKPEWKREVQKLASKLYKLSFNNMLALSNRYYVLRARANKEDITDLKGRELVLETGPYKWYLLKSLAAYKEEGKFLQNCIGSIYKPNSKNDIYVMKDKTGDSHVAIRIQGSNLIEIKGKNNKPPIDKYLTFTKMITEKLFSEGNITKISEEYFKIIDGHLFTLHEAFDYISKKFKNSVSTGILDDEEKSIVQNLLPLRLKSKFSPNQIVIKHYDVYFSERNGVVFSFTFNNSKLLEFNLSKINDFELLYNSYKNDLINILNMFSINAIVSKVRNRTIINVPFNTKARVKVTDNQIFILGQENADIETLYLNNKIIFPAQNVRSRSEQFLIDFDSIFETIDLVNSYGFNIQTNLPNVKKLKDIEFKVPPRTIRAGKGFRVRTIENAGKFLPDNSIRALKRNIFSNDIKRIEGVIVPVNDVDDYIYRYDYVVWYKQPVIVRDERYKSEWEVFGYFYNQGGGVQSGVGKHIVKKADGSFTLIAAARLRFAEPVKER